MFFRHSRAAKSRCLRHRETSVFKDFWIPAFAGMTALAVGSSFRTGLWAARLMAGFDTIVAQDKEENVAF